MSDLPRTVKIREEGPREGFQIERTVIPTSRKIELINALSETGLQEIVIASFVNPKRVPGMADADDIVKGFEPKAGVKYRGLWLNERGFERARAVSNGKLAFDSKIGVYASEAFSLRNNNRTTAQEFEYARTIVRRYLDLGITVNRASVSNAFGCNFQGDISIATVLDLMARIFDIAVEYSLMLEEISLSDTMAWATPLAIKKMVGAIREKYPEMRLNLHLHDTRGMGIANAVAGLEMGVSMFDASIAGLGGCPFAGHKGAAGNVCTEDLVFVCEEMGIDTGVDLDKLIDCARLAEDIVGHPVPGSIMKGGSLARMRSALAH